MRCRVHSNHCLTYDPAEVRQHALIPAIPTLYLTVRLWCWSSGSAADALISRQMSRESRRSASGIDSSFVARNAALSRPAPALLRGRCATLAFLARP